MDKLNRNLYSPGARAAMAAQGPKEDPLKEQRRLAFESLDRQRAQYESQQAQQTQASIMQQLRGDSQPFGSNVVNSMMADVSDAGAGQYGNQREMILQAMANAGMSGSGAQARALINSQRQIGGNTRRERRGITSRAELENFMSQERAQTTAASFLRDQAANSWAATRAEVGLRSQFEVTKPQQQQGPVDTRVYYGKNGLTRGGSGAGSAGGLTQGWQGAPGRGSGGQQRPWDPGISGLSYQANKDRYAAANPNQTGGIQYGNINAGNTGALGKSVWDTISSGGGGGATAAGNSLNRAYAARSQVMNGLNQGRLVF